MFINCVLTSYLIIIWQLKQIICQALYKYWCTFILTWKYINDNIYNVFACTRTKIFIMLQRMWRANWDDKTGVACFDFWMCCNLCNYTNKACYLIKLSLIKCIFCTFSKIRSIEERESPSYINSSNYICTIRWLYVLSVDFIRSNFNYADRNR